MVTNKPTSGDRTQMMTQELKNFVARPLVGRLIWIAFAFLFFFSGLYTTEWLLQPEQFAGEWIQWVLVVLFPLLLVGFFVVNRRFGCASGACRVPSTGSCRSDNR